MTDTEREERQLEKCFQLHTAATADFIFEIILANKPSISI